MSLAKELLEVYKNNKIEETLRESDSWEMLYHLSPMRHNLLEWCEWKENASVLEIGAQAGALTDFFAEHTQKVVALDANADLLEVNREKNKAFSNIDYRVGTLAEIEENEKFDYITCIGAFERGTEYGPVEELLEGCRKFLKEDGIIILAGDNKTSMRYWAGAPENGKNFSKIQYEKMLEAAGYEDITFYYPTPDYRFVSSLFSDEFLPQAGELRPENGVYMPGGYQFFNEDLGYNIVCADGQYPYFAESFLIFANNSK